MNRPVQSLQHFLDADRAIAKVKMNRLELKRIKKYEVAAVIVEGETDQLVYEFLFNFDRIDLVYACGKKDAIRAVDYLVHKDLFQGVIAIVDNDFDGINDIYFQNPNIVVTDQHDLETMILFSRALFKYLRLLISPAKHKFLPEFQKFIEDKLIELGKPIGCLRLISNQRNLCLFFKNLNFENFIDKNRAKINIEKLVAEVLERNPASPVTNVQLHSWLNELNQQELNPRIFCQGHDLVKILQMILEGCLLTYYSRDKKSRENLKEIIKDKAGSDHRVTEWLYHGYEYGLFKNTEIYKKVRIWEKANYPYSILLE